MSTALVKRECSRIGHPWLDRHSVDFQLRASASSASSADKRSAAREADKNPYSAARISSVLFWPPKPKLLERAAVTGVFRGSFAT